MYKVKRDSLRLWEKVMCLQVLGIMKPAQVPATSVDPLRANTSVLLLICTMSCILYVRRLYDSSVECNKDMVV